MFSYNLMQEYDEDYLLTEEIRISAIKAIEA